MSAAILRPETLPLHRSLLGDRKRSDAYRRAILRTVRRGDVVLDLGSGSGILAFFACQAGAHRVYAIERGGMVEVAKRICRQNGWDGRVVFLHRSSLRARLPERVDVLVTETIGNLGLEEGILGSVIDAGKRFLKPGGRILPRTLELFAAPVELPAAYGKVEFWSGRRFGVALSAARAFAVNTTYPVDLRRRSLLGEPVCLLRLDLRRIAREDLDCRASFTIRRKGILQGVGGWFSAGLCPGIALTNAPPNAVRSWKQRFLPLERPVPVRPGEHLEFRLSFRGNGSVLSWQVSSGRRFRFGHSTLFGAFPPRAGAAGGS